MLLFGRIVGEVMGYDLSLTRAIGYFVDGKSDFTGTDWWRVTPADGYAMWLEPTHWMPLPFPPTS